MSILEIEPVAAYWDSPESLAVHLWPTTHAGITQGKTSEEMRALPTIGIIGISGSFDVIQTHKENTGHADVVHIVDKTPFVKPTTYKDDEGNTHNTTTTYFVRYVTDLAKAEFRKAMEENVKRGGAFHTLTREGLVELGVRRGALTPEGAGG